MSDQQYQWIDEWATVPESESSRTNGRTHAICVTNSGNVMVWHQAVNALVTFDTEGTFVNAVGGDRWMGAHGMTRVLESDEEFLLLTDEHTGEVVKTTLAGEVVQSIERADHPAYQGDDASIYKPTWATQNPVNGDIWVADGYGAWLVHRYDRDGQYLHSIDGTEGPKRFRETHGIHFTQTESGDPELFITDRAHHRIAVYDSDGHFLRDSDVAHSPCGFDFHDGMVLIPELFTGIKLLRADTLELMTEIGMSDHVRARADGEWWPPEAVNGWPNLAGTEYVRSDFFNSPHGACFAPNGDIYVAEWLIGGRITKLLKM